MNATKRFKAWIAKKWDTAETWLPGFLIAVSIVTVLIVAVVRFFVEDGTREPAAFVEITDSEVPAHTIYADGHIDETNQNGKKSQAGSPKAHFQSGRGRIVANGQQRKGDSERSGSQSGFIFALKDSPTASEISKRTGIGAQRARAVVLAPDVFARSPGKELALQFDLFEDTQPLIIFKVVSGYEVNSGIHTGRAEDDPNSQVSITTADGMVSGFIKYREKNYRIVSDPERGIHYIIEVQ
jgi:hypothetical protein